MTLRINTHQFLENICEQDLVLTANRRLAAYLQKKYDQLQVNNGKSAWNSLAVMPLLSWLEQLWEDTGNSYKLLSDFQELMVWEQVISQSTLQADLLNKTSSSHLVKDGWQLLNAWMLELEDIAYSLCLDVQTFICLATAFKEKCMTHEFMSRSEIPKKIIETMKRSPGVLAFPKRIFIVGFDDIAPAIKTFLGLLPTTSLIRQIQFTQENTAQVVRTCLSESKHEMLEMARWAYACLLNEPEAKIGCVMPNLAEKRQQITNIFTDVFYAQQLDRKFSALPFNISAADAFKYYPMIHIALKILTLNFYEISLADISCLLLTPFIKGSASEFSLRAQLDVRLCFLGESHIELPHLLNRPFLAECKILSSLLTQFALLKNNQPKRQSLEKWARLFEAQLTAMGWPGDRILNSSEYQQLERFKKLLTEYVSLESFLHDITCKQAVDLLHQLLGATLFQPKSSDMPIQILGILEAGGIYFDYLWIAGMDNETWPASCAPNPFIPIEIQNKLQMPHASSERELQFSTNVTKRFVENASKIIFSHAAMDNDRHLSPSSLIINYPLAQPNLTEFSSLAKIIFQSQNLEFYSDDCAPVLEQEWTTGGSSIFKSQAACPFQAFAKFRLGAYALNTTQLGLAAHEKGSLVHAILAQVWHELQTHENLSSLNEQSLCTLVNSIIEIQLQNIHSRKPFTLKKSLWTLEKKRLLKLIIKWLALEKNRQPFKVISSERSETVRIGSLAMQVQIDRIDELADGSWLILDYKTSKTSIADWFSDRPKEPQLPLYSMRCEQRLSGVSFAQVRLDDMVFKGVIADEHLIPGVTSLAKLKTSEFNTMGSLTLHWKKILQQLADDFCQGVASVDPKDATTCQYCQLQSLCRIRA